MINIANAEWIFSIIVAIIVYYISIIINNTVQTKVTSKLGDDTLKNEGYGSLDSIVHFDPINFIMLVIFNIYWPSFLPINVFNIDKPYKYLKSILAYATESIVSLLIAFVSLFISILCYGGFSAIALAKTMIFYNKAPLTATNLFLPHSSLLSVVFALILTSFVCANIYISVISFILNTFRYILVLAIEKRYKYVEYAHYLTFIGPLIVILFFTNKLRYMLLRLIIWAVYLIVSLIGS